MQSFHSPGKLLLTGEYVVLDGAKALAIPTRYGQSMEVVPTSDKNIIWNSIDHLGNTWFEEVFSKDDLIYKSNANTFSDTLGDILKTAKDLNPKFLKTATGFEVTTRLDFPRDWGLGTSSTLIHNIAQWAQVDAHTLLQQSFGGSGYDVAIAKANAPILYQLESEVPVVTVLDIPWNFTSSLFFIHLNQKQDSKEGIRQYRKSMEKDKTAIEKISEITRKVSQCTSLSEFSELLELHERLISEIVGLPTIKNALFKDFKGTIKSLGAWGGDFILVVAEEVNDLDYFKEKGYTTIIPFDNMIA
ncbi:MAG: GHMP kinase [Flavobacteriaceae bacterium]|nr:GHMP kinase [Flavobacteriaceae bacterium]